MKLFSKKYMGVFCGDPRNIGCSEFKRAWKIWQPSILLLCFEDFPDSLNALTSRIIQKWPAMICPPCPLALKQVLFALMRHFNCDLIAITLIVFSLNYTSHYSFGTSCHLKEAIVLTTTWPDISILVSVIQFQHKWGSSSNKQEAPEGTYFKVFLKLNKVSGRSSGKLRSTKFIFIGSPREVRYWS